MNNSQIYYYLDSGNGEAMVTLSHVTVRVYLEEFFFEGYRVKSTCVPFAFSSFNNAILKFCF